MKKFLPDSARKKTLLLLAEAHVMFQVAAILILAIFWVGIIQLVRYEDIDGEKKAIETSRELVDMYESHMMRNLGFIDQTLKVVKYAYEQRGSAGVLAALEKREILPPKLVFTVSILNRAGDVVASTAKTRQPSMAGQAFFHTHTRGDSVRPSINLVKDESMGRRIQFSRRLNTANGAFNGVVMVSVEPDFFTSDYDPAAYGQQGLMGMVGTNGVYWAKRTGDQVVAGEPAFKIMTDLSVVEDQKNPLPELHFVDNVKRFASAKRLHGYPLAIVVGLSTSEQMAAAKAKKETYLWAAGIISSLFAALAIFVTRLLVQLNLSQKRSRKNQETYYAASEASSDGIYVLRALKDQAGMVTDFVIDDLNQRGAALLGKFKEDLIGQKISDQMPQSRNNGLLEALLEVYKTGEKHESEWKKSIPALGIEWMHREIVRVEEGVVAVTRDITDRKRTEERITHMAHHDTLTGLPNRSLLNERLQQAILRAKRDNRHVTVAFVDLDNFKPINDTLGHRVGDELLKTLAARMSQCVRQTDSIIRLGGDEFLIILGDQPDDHGVLTQTLQRIRTSITQPIYFEGNKLMVTSSMGLARYPEDAEDTATLVQKADTAMYYAKMSGRDTYQYYTEGMKMHGELGAVASQDEGTDEKKA
ncbi:MAG: sensor domain-containing diguanylate cyclase [Oxalobacter sp.]|nr:MAG: sensor domain-containing diguanylate cyclase [Oxalobacter sp.]